MIQQISIQIYIALMLLQHLIIGECASVCPFTNYKNALLVIDSSTQSYTESINDSENYDTFGFAFWSISIPLLEKLETANRDGPFKNDVSEDGQLLFFVKDSSTTSNFIYGFKSYDYLNRQVKHTIKFINQDISQKFIFSFGSLEYEGIWIYHQVLLQPALNKIIVEMSNQEKQQANFDLQNQLSLQISIGGRGYIDSLNLNSFRGKQSKLIYLPKFAYSTNTFSQQVQTCKIPPMVTGEQTINIISGLRLFEGNQVLQQFLDLYGNRYCIQGWVKYLLPKVDEQSYTLLKLSGQSNFEKEITLGDELFRVESFISKKNPKSTSLIINADAYGMPVKQSFQSQYDLLFQGSGNPDYSVLQAKRTYQDLNTQLYFEGLQQWHYIQYEYGRSNIDQRMLLQIQFSNDLGKLYENLGNHIFSGSFTNARLNLFFGGDTTNSNTNHEFIEAYIYDFKMQFNYAEDKLFNLNCHYTCKTCEGPLISNCLTCDANSNRFYQVELKMCKCNSGYLDKGIPICDNKFYSSVQQEEQPIDLEVPCPIGYFRLPKDDGSGYDCLLCPQMKNFFGVLCADCYFYPLTFYLEPVCTMDFFTIKQLNDYEAYHLIKRTEAQNDAYSIESDRALHLNPEIAYYCYIDSCLPQVKYHLGKPITAECKPSYYYHDEVQLCLNPGIANCLKVNIIPGCSLCAQGYYLVNYNTCGRCPTNCYACISDCYDCSGNRGAICNTCIQYYNLQQGVCKQCGLRCDFCKDYYDQYLGKNYLKCLKCIDDSLYSFSFDGINCISNVIPNCVHSFSALIDDYTINTLDIYFVPQFDQSKIELLCAKCQPNYVFVFETKSCVFNNINNQCDIGIGSLKSSDQSLESVTCLKSYYYENQIVEFMEKCENLVNDCQVCLETNIQNYYTCLECQNGYYAEYISNRCVQCPSQLNCISCYSQHSVSKDHWKKDVRAFYKKYIEIKNTHQYILNAQSQNVSDYEVVCSVCQDGYRLYKNKCIKYCSDTCAECLFKDDQYYCVRCQNDQKGRKQSTYLNECIECPEDCALCRPRTSDEILQINPLFNSTKYAKYSHQCILSFQDQDYSYDEDIGVFIHCESPSPGGCYKQLVIRMNAYGDATKYYQDYNTLTDEESRLQFRRENFQLNNFFVLNQTFGEYQNDEFYSLANANHVKSILIQITSAYTFNFRSSYLEVSVIRQVFSQSIFSLINVELEFNFHEGSTLTLTRDMSISFLNFNKVTIKNLKIIECAYCENDRFLFNSVFPQTVVLNNIYIDHTSQYSGSPLIFSLQNISKFYLDGFTIEGINNDGPSYIFVLESTTFSKQIAIKNFKIFNTQIKDSRILELNLRSDDQVSFENFNISGIYELVNLIKINSEDFKGGQITMNNILITANITNSREFIHFETASSLSISNFVLYTSVLGQSVLILLNHVAKLENMNFTENQIMDNSVLLYNSNLRNNQIKLIYQLNNIKFENNKYNSVIKFIYFQKYSSLDQTIQISQLSQLNNQLIDATLTYNMKLETSSLILIQFNQVQVSDFLINRGYGFNDITITECLTLSIQNGIIIQNKFNFLGLHKYLPCQLLYVDGQYFSISLNIISSKDIRMQNLTFSKVESYNFPYISIILTDILKDIDDSNIVLKDIVFSESLILLSDPIFQTALIGIQSSQETVISIYNVTFKNNLLHSYIEEGFILAAGLLYVDCPYCQISIQHSTFLNNLVTNSSSSIMYIKSQQLEISNCLFENNNIFNYKILQPYLIWAFTQTVTQKAIRQFFKVTSTTGNGQIITEQLKILNSTFSNSGGKLGGCFSVSALRTSRIEIINNVFQNFSTLFITEIEQGGVFYIDGSSTSYLEIIIKDLTVRNVHCRQYGGFLYLKSNNSEVHLTITDGMFNDIYAQQGSVIYASYSNLVEDPQTVNIQEIEIINSQSGYIKYLNEFKELSTQQEISSLINNRSSIYIEDGSNILIQNISVNNLKFESFLNLESSNFIYISDIVIEDSQISNNLIRMSQNQYVNLIRILFRSIIVGFKEQSTGCSITPDTNQIINYACAVGFGGAPAYIENDIDDDSVDRGLCVNNIIRLNLDLSISGLIIINDIEDQDYVKISQFDLSNISCSSCTNGVLYLQFLNETTLQQTQLVQNLKVTNSICGNKGCMVVEKLLGQDGRILTQQEAFQQEYELQITDYICENNLGFTGTCLILNSIFTLIQDSVLQHNNATFQGGAIVVKGSDQIIIENSLIQYNKAEVGGGMYLEKIFALNYELLKTRVILNSANFYGDNVASNPEKLAIQITQNEMLQSKILVENSTTKIEEVVVKPFTSINGKNSKFVQLPTGQQISTYQFFDWRNQNYINYDLIFRIHAQNRKMHLIQNLSSTACTINSRRYNISEQDEDQEFTNNFTKQNTIFYNSETQDYNLDELIVYFDNDVPEEIVLQLEFQCDSIKIPIFNTTYPYQTLSFHNDYSLRINVKTLECQFGEIKNLTDFSCAICDSIQGLFSLTLNAQKCDIQDDISTISVRSNQLQLRPGYWRPYFDTSEISTCINLQSNCLGGWKNGDISCYVGHIGALCEQCDLYDTRGDGSFSVVSRYSCGSCQDKYENIALIAGIIIVTLIFLLISIKGTLNSIDEFSKFNPFIRSSHTKLSPQSSILIKILTNYFQIIATITTFQLQLPQGLVSTIDGVGNPIQTATYSLDCFLVNFSNIQIQYTRMIWQIILPILYITLFMGLFFIASKQRLIGSTLNCSVMSTTLIYCYIYFQPNLINGFVQLVSYRDISGFKWIKANVADRYDTLNHLQWMLKFSMPALIILAILIPCFFFYGLFSNRNNLTSKKEVKMRWAYLYVEYKDTVYFWELVKIIEKELIILSLIYYEDSIVIKGVLVLLITYLYQELNQNYQPYSMIRMNKLDYYSANICMITICLAIGAYIAQEAEIKELQIPFLVIMALLNFLFLQSILVQIVSKYAQQYEDTLDKIKDFIKKQYPSYKSSKYLDKVLESRTDKRNRIMMLFQKLKKFAIPLGKLMIQTRENYQKTKQKISTIEFHTRQETLDVEKSSQKRLLALPNIK
ncbi:unnamed protein product (macronuclear) [Paramecium tetraurelia]|uniref:Laminin EGF-like domain-containing protein n=1 Tax=Paramecium tetraurelia TaxID=5888 RepID=A0CBW4_PARTE|nr:uncharacterized protein GSPATT00037064001 [Paramecium tetraurelia]CAK68281.1 unnamed protein product [Paramecium tetraurelia]|eukprot:XP_001435678.1 hypothetical protein (macronuclear) [Paramecium tetraurelia strain d4-2]